ncbi:MAG TPA: S8 family peptidase [Chitinophagaceae bacterium]|nr:S8 family peptidase [Chitinophagaceae bacterium]
MLPRKCRYGLVLACILYYSSSLIANDIVQVRFSSDADLPAVTHVGAQRVSVFFKDGELTRIFAGYNITTCLPSYPMVLSIPHPLSPALSRVYEFVLESGADSLMKQLDAYTGTSVINKYLVRPPEELLMPNDYNSDPIPCGAGLQALKYLELIGAREAWNITTGDPKITIAVPDNGFNKNHEDLAGKIVNPATPTGVAAAHGTAVLGLAAANTNNGVGISSVGYHCRLLAYETGLRHFPQAILAGAKVINCSWYASCSFNQNDQHMINIAHDMGVVVVAAAGNGGTCGGPGNYVYPASYDHVISVTGVGHYFPRNISSCNGKINHEDVHVYRANGSAPYQTLQHNDKVDLAAPAYEVRSLSLSGYTSVTGSSFASPIVAGVCGLLFSINHRFTPDEIEGILKCTAVDLDTIPENAPYAGLLGAGRLNAHKAALKAKSMMDNSPAGIIWYYYNKRGNKIIFDPGELYQHIHAGAIAGNTIFTEAISKIPGIGFNWEFIKGECSIYKTGNPVAFDLTNECPDFWYTLVAQVSNRVAGICDEKASVAHREAAYLDESSGCMEPRKGNLGHESMEYESLGSESLEYDSLEYENPKYENLKHESQKYDSPKHKSLWRESLGHEGPAHSGPGYRLSDKNNSGSFTISNDLPPRISIYPNPARNHIILDTPEEQGLMKAVLVSAAGQLLRTIQLRKNRTYIDLSGLKPGVYFLRLDGNDNRVIKKVVIAD